MLPDLCFSGLAYYQCHSWPHNPLHTCFRVHVITFYVCVFMCENKDDDDDDDDIGLAKIVKLI